MRQPPTLLLAQFAPLHERTFALLERTKKMGLINRLPCIWRMRQDFTLKVGIHVLT